MVLRKTTEEPRNKASANKENPPITTWIFSPQILFLLILYIGNKASLAIRQEINWSLEMRYCGVPLYLKDGGQLFALFTSKSLKIPP